MAGAVGADGLAQRRRFLVASGRIASFLEVILSSTEDEYEYEYEYEYEL